MLVSAAIPRISYILRGTDDDPPESGSDDWNYWLDTLNRKKNELYRDTKKKWDSAYDVPSLGTVTASAALVFDLPANFLALSNNPYVIDTNGNRHELDLVEPQARETMRQSVFVAGFNPKKLYFANEIESDDAIVGGELFAPGY